MMFTLTHIYICVCVCVHLCACMCVCMKHERYMIHERYRFSDKAHIYDEKGRDTSTLSAPQIYEDQIHLRHYIRVHTLLQTQP